MEPTGSGDRQEPDVFNCHGTILQSGRIRGGEQMTLTESVSVMRKIPVLRDCELMSLISGTSSDASAAF